MTFEARRIRRADDPLFQPAYELLHGYFGERGEMETIDVIRSRMEWDPSQPIGSYALSYEIVVALNSEGVLVAARDHSVVIDIAAVRDQGRPAIVHLSHIYVDPRHRGRRLINMLHSFPVEAARDALSAAGLARDSSIVLAAEVEPYVEGDLERTRRLQLFRHEGYRPADPAIIPYVQPDFREPEIIVRDGGPNPLPLILMLQRCGKEDEAETDSDEIRHIVRSLYEMYGHGMWPEHMKAAYKSLDAYPDPGTPVPLVWERVLPEKARPRR